jgi:membrane protein implicated in regulation of membrane protease activity
MNDSTASKQPKSWLGFLVVAVPCVWVLYFWVRDWTVAAIASFMSLYLVVEAWNALKRKRAAQKDPASSKMNGLGT